MDAETGPAPPDTVAETEPARSRLAACFLAASAALLLAGVVGYVDPLGLVWVDRLLDHPFVFGTLAAAFFGYGAALLTERLWLAVLLATPCLLVAMGWASYGVFSSEFLSADEVAAVAAPAGEGADFEVVVTELPVFMEEAWVVSVRQTGSPLAREWEVGCLVEDPTEVEPISWTGRDQFVMTTAGGRVPVHVNAHSGRPGPVDGYPWNQCADQ